MGGYIKLYRKMQDWEWYQDPCTKSVFIDLLLSAAFQTTSYKGVELQAGQVALTVQKLADRLGFTPKQVRLALERLEKGNQITRRRANRFTVVTVENWAFYQGERVDEGNERAIKGAIKRQSKGNCKEEEVKEVKEYNNNITPLTPQGADAYGWFVDSVSTKLADTTRNWLRYKQERNQKYKPTGLHTLLKKIQAMSKQHSEEAVIAAIEDSIANGYQGIVWDRLSRYKPTGQKKTNWEEWLNDKE